MTTRTVITMARWAGVGLYALINWFLTRGGATALDLWYLTFAGMFLLSYVVLIDWIADARKPCGHLPWRHSGSSHERG